MVSAGERRMSPDNRCADLAAPAASGRTSGRTAPSSSARSSRCSARPAKRPSPCCRRRAPAWLRRGRGRAAAGVCIATICAMTSVTDRAYEAQAGAGDLVEVAGSASPASPVDQGFPFLCKRAIRLIDSANSVMYRRPRSERPRRFRAYSMSGRPLGTDIVCAGSGSRSRVGQSSRCSMRAGPCEPP